MKVAENFIIQEFVPKEIYEKFGERSIQFVDPKIIQVVQTLRELLGKSITVNNWHSGGQYNESGFRTPNTSTGAGLSQHKFGRAADIKVDGMTSKEVYDFIIKHKAFLMPKGLTTLENINATPTWVHCDVRYNSENKDLLIVNP